MTQKELALLIGKNEKTIRNWKKENPELLRLIKQGLALDQTIEETEKHLENLKKIKEQASK
ncbi:MAG: hypothetical protein P794_05015 [Epsilonproteobacteria bacterium (ex Lamellibrachia satsuma)]|nr:MAG: hypothetical protein P794_05015 [Epsilonproteobacteria bacterium (ex Lamellibrachia satsuma)]